MHARFHFRRPLLLIASLSVAIGCGSDSTDTPFGTGGSGASAGVSGSGGHGGTSGFAGESGGGGTGGSAGESGIGGSAGSGGSAGIAGSAGSAGTSGSAGSAGTSGSAGGAGVGGSAGTAGSGVGGIAPNSLVVVADTNRDGIIDVEDLPGRATWSWSRGAFLIANLDDDDGDGLPDGLDDTCDGAADALDLASVQVELGSDLMAKASSIHVRLVEGAAHANVFLSQGTDFVSAGEPLAMASSLTLGVEARRFAGDDWDGIVGLRVEARDASNLVLASDEVALKVAPWIMLPSSALPLAIHVAQGVYANQSFLSDLSAATAAAGVPLLAPFSTTKWQEMWMQDTMEIGYTQLPGRQPMHVVLRANRGQDDYPGTLIGPDVGYLEVGAPRSTPGGDAWVDWYGNLEVSPPVPGWPLGRIYYGCNTTTGMKLHPDVVAFLEAQEVQAPFWIDTSFLTIKHVDEIVTFVPASDGSPRMLVPSPREAGVLYPGYYGPYNQGIQAKIDKILHGGVYAVDGGNIHHEGVLARLNLDGSAVVELPLFYTDGHSDWSNPINGLYLGGIYVAGKTDLWPAEKNVISGRMQALGIDVFWADDAVYQHHLGNVHCATNATRAPVVQQFVSAIPGSL
jgi:protein-arginine deiminase